MSMFPDSRRTKWTRIAAAGLLAATTLAACGQQAHEARSDTAMAVDAAADSGAGPDIAVSAAPGVAFNYRYAFRLPSARIMAVQEGHAAACEKLGIAKCRITGMRYTIVDGDEVSAMLQFKLAPEIARQFGKDGIAAVAAAEGMLVDSEISGVDEGAAIKASQVRSAEAQDRIAELEKQLQRPGIKDAERARLQGEISDIRRALQGEAQGRADSAEALANTPMTFHYGTGSTIPGFDGASPLKDSWRAAVTSFVTMLGFVMMTVGVLLPWALLLFLLWMLWNSRAGQAIGKRLKPRPKPSAPAPVAEAQGATE